MPLFYFMKALCAPVKFDFFPVKVRVCDTGGQFQERFFLFPELSFFVFNLHFCKDLREDFFLFFYFSAHFCLKKDVLYFYMRDFCLFLMLFFMCTSLIFSSGLNFFYLRAERSPFFFEEGEIISPDAAVQRTWLFFYGGF